MENKIKIIDAYELKNKEVIINVSILSGNFFIGDVFSNKEKNISLKITGVGMDNIMNKSTYLLKVDILENELPINKLQGQELLKSI